MDMYCSTCKSVYMLLCLAYFVISSSPVRRGAGGMLPIHMACLSGYYDCSEALSPTSKEWPDTIHSYLCICSLLSVCVCVCVCIAANPIKSEVDDEKRTCLHAASCGA